jgi:hypothetical protein
MVFQLTPGVLRPTPVLLLLIPALLMLSGSCSESPDAPAPDDQMLKIDLQYGFRDELNTFARTLQKDLVLDGTVTVPFWLTSDEQDQILQKALGIDFFSLPDTLQREPGVFISPDPSPDLLRLQYGSQEKTVVWYYPQDPNDTQWKALLELRNVIIQVIQTKPEYKVLPAARGGYL